jgi:hypothetical protein
MTLTKEQVHRRAKEVAEWTLAEMGLSAEVTYFAWGSGQITVQGRDLSGKVLIHSRGGGARACYEGVFRPNETTQDYLRMLQMNLNDEFPEGEDA